MTGISFICVYNNENQVEEMKESVIRHKGNEEVEFILVDNTNNQFDSAAKALNYGFKKSTKEILVFLHQDIVFNEESDIKNIIDFLNQKPNSIVGVAGVNNGTEPSGIITSIYTGKEKNKKTTLTEQSQKVFTVDECLIAVKRDVFEKIKFDEKTCDNWHLYGADLCITAHEKGLEVFVVKSSVWHISNGKANKGFYISQKKLAQKHKKHYKRISYTFGWTYTNPMKYFILHMCRIIKHRKIMYY